MANFHIAFDNDDLALGYYFEASKNDIVSYININCEGSTINEISSPRCNQAYIDLFIPQINNNNFLFIVYSHGKPNCLTANGNSFIDLDFNVHHFINSFFYSMSCHAGENLGFSLVDNKCHAFIGYNDIAWVLDGDYSNLCMDCDNYGIKKFISGSIISDAFEQMKNNFSTQIDFLEQKGEIIYAAYLRKNRDSLVLIGNKDLEFNLF